MRIFNDAHSYKTPANAIAQLDKALASMGRSRNDVRWMVAINEHGRFSPVVSMGTDHELLALANANICVTN